MSGAGKPSEPIPTSSLGVVTAMKVQFRCHLYLPVGSQHPEDPGLICDLLGHLEDKEL